MNLDPNRMYYRGLSRAVPPEPAVSVLPNACQVARVVPGSYVPEDAFDRGRFVIGGVFSCLALGKIVKLQLPLLLFRYETGEL